MKYKMVVSDLDGTLLDDEKQINDKTVYILNELYKKGIEIVIATGRNHYMAKKLIEPISNLNPVILSNNGSVVRHNDIALSYNYLNPLFFEKIYKEGLRRGLNPFIHVDEYDNGYDIIYEKEDFENEYSGYIKKDYNRARLIKFDPLKTNKILSVCYFDEYNKLSDFGTEMTNPKHYNTIFNRNIGNLALLEFLHLEGCKWSSLKKYAAQKNIEPEDIIALGDDNNDIEMLKNAGMGIAMVNGTEEIKKAARRISKFDNNNSGVYYELKELFDLK
ncbi:HAD family hydrolase [Sedimentibacter hydroxybenzoicus DSM 7310]|uniref:HAD family hydrolase n=1 Tax=Sedimentibacter hydroxybenzoicus DSM 7310 TaxID=1123245 RepID=A0A974GY09_SEDHY|nr:HAD family hydrolase [Sedimentibacter hydroxybenzoicus]NYB75711.1 HAD family hydrolase [Sedimentibacter hydroxybenzoicus DSM 7310]